ncbi:MAG TPA: c-type cytochrome biogenesis protein CcmI [Azospirillaceae bacterium]|nr:c-type cytochrome biogenesis protein CcmI [Azospirillaceae bacterium]
MLFWILAGLLTAVAVALVLHPLMRRQGVAERAAFDMAVYRDQLAEVDRDLKRGLIAPEQAEAARAEIGRRLLRADAARTASDAAGAAPPGRSARIAALAVVVAVPLLALAVYLPTGRWDVPARPFAERPVAERGPPIEVLTALANLERHLEEDPRDLQAWILAANTYSRMGRFTEAAEAFRRAAGLSDGAPEFLSGMAEALIQANRGQVTDEARRAFEAVLSREPADLRARYYLGLAHAQDGDARGALERWAALLESSPPDAPWLDEIRGRIHELARRSGIDAGAYLPDPKGVVAPPAAPAGIPDEMAGRIAGLPPDQRAQAIRGMVEGLQARLETAPDDADGWLRLGRAWRVLGDAARAEAALERAIQAAPDRPDTHLALADLLLADQAPTPQGEGGLPARAVEALTAVLRLEPDSPPALWWLGVDAARQGRRAEAEALWRRLLGGMAQDTPARREVEEAIRGLAG